MKKYIENKNVESDGEESKSASACREATDGIDRSLDALSPHGAVTRVEA